MPPSPLFPTVRLLPWHAACADDLTYFAERLADPELLTRGVTLAVESAGRVLCVPAVGGRRSGFVATTDLFCGLAMRAVLDGVPGFPRVRFRWSPDPEVCHQVVWGDEVPRWDDRVCGQLYGYSTRAIDDYLAAMWSLHQCPADALTAPDQPRERGPRPPSR